MERPQKTRRTHTKSRGGCFECKRRKLKCNEEKPVCAGCRKREINCQYLGGANASMSPSHEAGPVTQPQQELPAINIGESSPSLAVTEGLQPYNAAITQARDVNQEKEIGHFDVEDMVIYHHFIKHTAGTLSNPWGDDLPKEAMGCNYLMHGILAMGALHLAYLETDEKKRERFNFLAVQHQDLALGPFQHAMATMTPETSGNVFAFGTLLMVFNFASFRSPEYLFPFCEGASYTGLSNWIVCLRGCASIYQVAQAAVLSSPLGYLIKRGGAFESSIAAGALPLPEEDHSLAQVTNVVLNLPEIKSITTVEEMEAYQDAIERLRNLMAAAVNLTDPVARRTTSSMWPCTISETFVRLLSEKKPPALIIMAHYALLLQKCTDFWYMVNRPKSLVEGVKQNLGYEWLTYIRVPEQGVLHDGHG